MSAVDDLRAWHDFFLLAGGASATLMGLVFVSVSLAPLIDDVDEATRGVGVFVTPIVFQFGYALASSALAIVPWPDARLFGAATALTGAAALYQSIKLLVAMLGRHRDGDGLRLSYWLLNGVLPLGAAALFTTGAALMLATDAFRPEPIAASTLGLDLLGVSNAWRLIIWIIARGRR